MRECVKQRKNGKLIGNDIFGTLIQIHLNSPEECTEEMLIKTATQFSSAGYGTTAESFNSLLYFVAVNPEVQSKLQEEIDAVFDGKQLEEDEFTDDDLIDLKYLDYVIQEAHRIVSVNINRQCTKPWKIPKTDIIVPVKTPVIISPLAFGRDPEFWEEPEEFRPERFSYENKGNIKSGTYLPFGQGPRKCPGTTYAQFAAKSFLIYLLRYFYLDNVNNFPKKFQFGSKSFLSPPSDFKLIFRRRRR